MLNLNIQMVDLQGQYLRLKTEIDAAIRSVIASARFIDGPEVEAFAAQLAQYMGVKHVVPCANGTDALQIAMMALGLKPGDEVIIPAFNYVAAAEAAALLGLKPVFVDIRPDTFNIDTSKIEEALSPRTRAIVAVHLFGQSADMRSVLEISSRHNLFTIGDNAQSLGAEYIFHPEGIHAHCGTMTDIATTSFFPSKPLACFGDGGAITTNDLQLAQRARMLAHHGQLQKYHHEIIGINSRLDTLQAAILGVKLRHIESFGEARRQVARRYDAELSGCDEWILPVTSSDSTHVYHQYTIRVAAKHRDSLQQYLKEKGVPCMIYYPMPLHRQNAYKDICRHGSDLSEAEKACDEVLSLPIHTEMTEEQQAYIIKTLKEWRVR